MPEKKRHVHFITVLLIAAIVCVGLLSVNCSIVKNEKNGELRSLESQLSQVQNEGSRMEIEIARRSDHFAIEAYASSELGMRKLETYQIQYIQQEVPSSVELLHTEQEDGFFSGVTKAFSVITEFFK